jgi:hypothetical protein
MNTSHLTTADLERALKALEHESGVRFRAFDFGITALRKALEILPDACDGMDVSSDAFSSLPHDPANYLNDAQVWGSGPDVFVEGVGLAQVFIPGRQRRRLASLLLRDLPPQSVLEDAAKEAALLTE